MGKKKKIKRKGYTCKHNFLTFYSKGDLFSQHFINSIKNRELPSNTGNKCVNQSRDLFRVGQDLFGSNQTISDTSSVSTDDKGHILERVLKGIKKKISDLWGLLFGCYSGYFTHKTFLNLISPSISPWGSLNFLVVSSPPNKPDLLCGKLQLKELQLMSWKNSWSWTPSHLWETEVQFYLSVVSKVENVLSLSDSSHMLNRKCLMLLPERSVTHCGAAICRITSGIAWQRGNGNRIVSTAKEVTREVLLDRANLLVLHNW